MDTDHKICHSILKHHLAERNCDFSPAGKLDCIGKEVNDDLADSEFISDHMIYGHILKFDLIVNSLCFQILREHIVEPPAKISEAETLVFKFYLAGLDPGHIQNVIDQCQQMPGKFFRLGQIGARRSIALKTAFCQRKHTHDSIHRCPDLMRHTIQECCFGLTFFFGFAKQFLVLFNLVMLLRGVCKRKKTVFAVRCTAHGHRKPDIIFHRKFKNFCVCTIPFSVMFPDAIPVFSGLEVMIQAGHIILKFL